MSSVPLGLWPIAAIVLLSIAIALLILAFFKEPVGQDLSRFGIASLIVIIGLAGTAVFISGAAPTQVPERNLAAEVGALVEQLRALNMRVERINSNTLDTDGSNVDVRQIEQINEQLRDVSTRTRRLESNAAGRAPTWAKLGALTAAVGIIAILGWLLVTPGSLAGTLTVFGAITITIVSFQIENLISLTFGAGGDASSWPVVVVAPPGNERTVRNLAYAINFPNGSSAIPRDGQRTIERIARALRPCIEPGTTVGLAVTGFTSSAPFRGQLRDESNSSNITLARGRTSIVKTALSEQLCGAAQCGPLSGVNVVPRDWNTYNGITGNRPVGDGSTIGNNRRDTEFLTRTVLIVLESPGRCAFQ